MIHVHPPKIGLGGLVWGAPQGISMSNNVARWGMQPSRSTASFRRWDQHDVGLDWRKSLQDLHPISGGFYDNFIQFLGFEDLCWVESSFSWFIRTIFCVFPYIIVSFSGSRNRLSRPVKKAEGRTSWMLTLLLETMGYNHWIITTRFE